MQKAANRRPQRGAMWARWLVVMLVSPWLLALGWSFCTVAPAEAQTKSRALPSGHAPAKKGQPVPDRSYERRLQQVVALVQQKKAHIGFQGLM
jgi:hypothetical protein